MTDALMPQTRPSVTPVFRQGANPFQTFIAALTAPARMDEMDGSSFLPGCTDPALADAAADAAYAALTAAAARAAAYQRIAAIVLEEMERCG